MWCFLNSTISMRVYVCRCMVLECCCLYVGSSFNKDRAIVVHGNELLFKQNRQHTSEKMWLRSALNLSHTYVFSVRSFSTTHITFFSSNQHHTKQEKKSVLLCRGHPTCILSAFLNNAHSRKGGGGNTANAWLPHTNIWENFKVP